MLLAETLAGHNNLKPLISGIDRFIGRKVKRWWPREGGWYVGVVTAHDKAQAKHCIAYDFMTPRETYEWFNLRLAGPSECVVMDEVVQLADVAKRNPAIARLIGSPAPHKKSGKKRRRVSDSEGSFSDFGGDGDNAW